MFISAYERTAVFLIELGNFRILMVILQHSPKGTVTRLSRIF